MPVGRGPRTVAHEVLLKRVVCWDCVFVGLWSYASPQYHKQNVFMMFLHLLNSKYIS